MPPWSGGLTQEAVGNWCPKGESCVVGIAHGLTDTATALKSARVNAYVQLAERVFPVHVAARFQSVETLTDSTATEATTTELVGRMRDARVLEEFWVKRQSYDVRGGFVVYDGWALVAVNTVRLRQLYEEEVARSMTEASAVQEPLRRAIAVVDNSATASPQDYVSAIVAMKAAQARLSALQDVAGKVDSEQLWVELFQRLDSKIKASISVDSYNLPGKTAEINLEVNAGGVGLPSVGVVIVAECKQVDGKIARFEKELVTDETGLVSVEVPIGSWLKPCPTEYFLRDVPLLRRSIPITMPWKCLNFRLDWAVRGYLEDEVKSAVVSREAELRGLVSASATLCGREVSGTADDHCASADIVLHLSGSLGNPVRVGGTTLRIGGTAVVGLLLRFAGQEFGKRDARSEAVAGLGANAEQMAQGLSERIYSMAEQTIKEMVSQL
jgi:hypothetical protein